MNPRMLALCLGGALLAQLAPAGAQTPAARTVIRDETQLPRFAYPMTVAPSALLVAGDSVFAPFAAKVGADVDATLRDYDIQDKATLRGLLSTRLALQMLAHDVAGARQTIAQLRAAATKPEEQLLLGRVYLAYLDAAAAATPASGAFDAAFTRADTQATDPLPWDVVQDAVKETYGRELTATRAAIVGAAQHDLDPIAARTGTLDGPSARELVQLRVVLLVSLPYADRDAAVLKAYIAQHDVVKPDIWNARDVTLEPAQIKAPVAIGIWDSGVDPSDYPSAMYVDPAGRHGLAFTDEGAPSMSDLYPVSDAVKADYPHLVTLMTGQSDLQSGIQSPEAQATAQYLRSLSSAQHAELDAEFDQIGEYTHGSHVAGIASRGNPGARLVVARFDDNLPDMKFLPTTEWANRMAQNFSAIAAYFRDNHVRVVNMSWGDTVSEFEEWLAKTDKESSATARKAKAQELFAIWRSAVENVIKGTPGTLFVAAAGNGDNDASFAQDVPASFTFPNVLVVGAVNQAGDATGFTSFGPTVAVYADGYHVPSKLPGGYVVKFSGTSMAAPNVTNLAAKLFALDPSLTPEQVRALIVKGATPVPGGKLPLIDPRRSIELLVAR